MILLTYRYLFKKKDDEQTIGVRYVTDTAEGLKSLEEIIRSDPDILSCVREYISSVDCSLIGIVDKIKEELKDETLSD